MKGFDYGANWCGWEEYEDANHQVQGRAHGYKLVLEIPIVVKDDVVGGPSVETNDEGSQLIIKDENDNVLQSFEFISPTVKIPVTIWIKKEGLQSKTVEENKPQEEYNPQIQGHEDNAVFRKTKFIGLYETGEEGAPLDGGKRIEYTYAKDENGNEIVKKYIVNGVETEMKWKTFTKVSVNMRDDEDGIVKISGLDADYVYRIEEDAWAHLGYDFDPNATARYTIEWDATQNEGEGGYKEVQNPFTFTNTPKGTVYAEQVIRNEFDAVAPLNGTLNANYNGFGTEENL